MNLTDAIALAHRIDAAFNADDAILAEYAYAIDDFIIDCDDPDKSMPPAAASIRALIDELYQSPIRSDSDIDYFSELHSALMTISESFTPDELSK